MPAPLINFPLSVVLDGLLSYTQHLFSKPEITPAEYRYNTDDRKSRIRICAPFVIDNEKPMSAPFVVIERGSFNFANRAIDNLKSGTDNAMESKQSVDWMDGSINIICGSGVGGEASSLANFLAIMFQYDRHGIISTLRFVRNLYYIDVGPEIPVVKDAEIRRWEVTLRLFCSLQIGWVRQILEPLPWNKAAIKAVSSNKATTSITGIVTQGSDLLYDVNKKFGPLTTDDPQILEQELEKKWYYVRFTTDEGYELYPVKEIVDEHTLKLLHHDTDNQEIPWSAPESAVDVSYELLWNSIHISMELPHN